MKNKQSELDVDFIGGQGSLTREEEISISEFLKAQKLLRIQNGIRKTKVSNRKQVLA
jgi:hypothetical protein